MCKSKEIAKSDSTHDPKSQYLDFELELGKYIC